MNLEEMKKIRYFIASKNIFDEFTKIEQCCPKFLYFNNFHEKLKTPNFVCIFTQMLHGMSQK